MLPYHFQMKIRVRYVETDKMGVVWHGNYLQYFEVARSEAMRAAGIGSYSQLENAGIMMPVTDVALHYHKGAVYDEQITVHVHIEEPLRSIMKFRYEIKNENDELLVDGSTSLAFINIETRKPCKPPLFMRQFFS